MDTIDALNQIGQHLWLDDISTTALDDGVIARYRDECSVTGVTANPTIFEHAISSHAYDQRIAASDAPVEETFWELAVDDVRRAADLFADIHRRTGERAGWVSVELSPRLAHDPEGSVSQAMELRARLDRPNVMVKVPGTQPGLQAIEDLTSAAVPVNVTLLFGIDQWRAVADAYTRGLERRLASGRSPFVPSVASFFLSRVDRRLDPMLPEELRHRAAIALAAEVYDEWRTLLDSTRWQRLADEGAMSQQLLWASTSPKSDELAETYYATRLAAPDTVITLPSQTLDALCAADGAQVRPLAEFDDGDAGGTLAKIEQEAEVTLADVAADLQRDGIHSFSESFGSLLSAIELIRKAVTTA